MPEQLRASAAIMGAGSKNISMATDGRYSGASHAIIIGHVVPEAAVGGPIAVVRDDDVITIDAVKGTITMDVDDKELQRWLAEWKAPVAKVKRGTLAKYLSMRCSRGMPVAAP